MHIYISCLNFLDEKGPTAEPNIVSIRREITVEGN
jgi:hypothetical protein